MDKSTNRSIERYWRNEAEKFDELYREHSKAPLSKLVRRFLVRRLEKILLHLDQIKKEDWVLDVGCGSGFYLGLVLERGARAIGLDISPAMLSISRHRCRWESNELRLLNADARCLPVRNEQMNWILAIGLLDYLPNPLEVLKEFKRVLTSDGKLIVTVPKSPSPVAFLRTPWGLWLRKILFQLPPVCTVMTRDAVEKNLADTGFRIRHIEAIQGTMWLIEAEKNSR